MSALLNGRVILAFAFFVVMLYYTITATTFTAEARLVPLAIGIPTLLLLGLELVRASLQSLRDGQKRQETDLPVGVEDDVSSYAGSAATAAEARGEGADPASNEDVQESSQEISAPGALAWLVAYFIAYLVLGFVVASSLFILLCARVYGRERWPLSIWLTVGVVALLYGVFVRVVGVGVYGGLISDLL